MPDILEGASLHSHEANLHRYIFTLQRPGSLQKLFDKASETRHLDLVLDDCQTDFVVTQVSIN